MKAFGTKVPWITEEDAHKLSQVAAERFVDFLERFNKDHPEAVLSTRGRSGPPSNKPLLEIQQFRDYFASDFLTMIARRKAIVPNEEAGIELERGMDKAT